jgi:hypothetical protein
VRTTTLIFATGNRPVLDGEGLLHGPMRNDNGMTERLTLRSETMKNTLITLADGHEAEVRAMERERRNMLRQRLCEEVEWVLSHDACDELLWTGTLTDLMEALHMTYVYGRMTDEEGELLTFKAMVRMACGVLHVKEPRNPWAKVGRANTRKGVHRSTFMQRYGLIIDQKPAERPLRRYVRKAIEKKPPQASGLEVRGKR